MRRRDFLTITAGSGLALALTSEAALAAKAKQAKKAKPAKAKVYTSQKAKFRVVELASGLDGAWGFAFLPTGELLITENGAGRLRVFKNGKLETKAIGGVPKDVAKSGLHDIAVHPNFASNRLIFLSYLGGSSSSKSTHVARATLNGTKLTNWKVIFRAEPGAANGGHHGNRVVVDGSGHVYIACGDRENPERAQRLDDLAGKVCRVRDDGTVPSSNPFVGTAGVRPEIWTIGHRNPQGLTLRPGTGELWQSEHGPTGGDEINLLKPGQNYGWPRATHGTNPDGSPIGGGPIQPGLTPPVFWWKALSLKPPASVAPSGIAFYDASRFPGWKGNLFVAMLKGMYLSRLELDGSGKVVKEEQLLKKTFGRLRAVKPGPDGLLYLITDRAKGKLLRLEPA